MAIKLIKDNGNIDLSGSNGNVELKKQTVNLAKILEAIESNSNEILAAIDQAVFDKQLLVDILGGTCENLTGDAITALADYCFYNNTTLKSVYLPNCISVGNETFNNCKSLASVTIPNCIEIGNKCFQNTIIEELNLPLVTYIPDYALYMNKALNTANLPNVNIIESNAFNGCQQLTQVNAPLLETIGISAFSNCHNLEYLDLTNVKTIEKMGLTNNPNLDIGDGYLPNLISIGDNGFQGCKKITMINAPNLETIGTSVFINCTSLESVNIPKSRVLGGFSGCSKLQSINAPLITNIHAKACSSCTALKKIWIPGTVTTISASSATNSPFIYCSADLQIFCEASSKPSGWGSYWNNYQSGKKLNVHWGATYEDYLAYEV